MVEMLMITNVIESQMKESEEGNDVSESFYRKDKKGNEKEEQESQLSIIQSLFRRKQSLV